MKIKSCTVSINSKKELYDVETVCFAHNIDWYYCGNTHRDDKDINIIFINGNDADMVVTDENMHTDVPGYTAEEFIKKFGKTTEYKQKYRIKTKEEFIDEFGKGWRDKTEYYFATSMDDLFGNALTEAEAEEYLTKSEIENCGWNISKDMITEIKQEKHKQKKPSIIDRFITTQKVVLSDSLYRHRTVNLNQNK